MVRKAANGQLEEAMAVLINNQSSFLTQMTHSNAQIAQLNARSEERFFRIESELAEIKAILLRHEQMLQALPEAIRERIGFTPPQ